MLRVTNDLFTSVVSGSAAVLVTLDLTAAFDTVNHSKLLRRIEDEFGITGSALSWIASYLHNRHQFVKVGSSRAINSSSCSTGVPQGSVLGPLLFTLYIAPVERIIAAQGVQHHSYADDITLYLSLGASRFALASRSKILACADTVRQWFLENDLLLNAEKSEIMNIGTTAQINKSEPENSYSVAGADITAADAVKIVGVTLDSRLSFDKFVAGTCSSCALHTRALSHILPLLDMQTANALACSVVGSRLDYCNSLLAGDSAHKIGRLQRTQNHAAKAVCWAS